MYMEELRQYLDDNHRKESKVYIKTYAAGNEHLDELTYAWLGRDSEGNLIILADVN